VALRRAPEPANTAASVRLRTSGVRHVTTRIDAESAADFRADGAVVIENVLATIGEEVLVVAQDRIEGRDFLLTFVD
jgi:hypothetical protein